MRLLILLCMLLCVPTLGQAEDIFTITIKKQEEKKSSGWNLSDWLAQRDRMRLQDLWLALHSPSPYEFYLGGDYQLSVLYPGGGNPGWSGVFAAYASIFGLEGKFAGQGADLFWQGLFHLRVFGYHAQGTNITLHLGMRGKAGAEAYRSPVLGGGLSIYMSKYFGVDGAFDYYFPSTPTVQGNWNGYRFGGGVFIDFSFFRLFLNYYAETIRNSSSEVVRAGPEAGLKLYF